MNQDVRRYLTIHENATRGQREIFCVVTIWKWCIGFTVINNEQLLDSSSQDIQNYSDPAHCYQKTVTKV